MGLREKWGPTIREAGTFKYPGDTALDMVYGMTDMISDMKRKLPADASKAIRPEEMAVRKALHKLETAVKKATKG